MREERERERKRERGRERKEGREEGRRVTNEMSFALQSNSHMSDFEHYHLHIQRLWWLIPDFLRFTVSLTGQVYCLSVYTSCLVSQNKSPLSFPFAISCLEAGDLFLLPVLSWITFNTGETCIISFCLTLHLLQSQCITQLVLSVGIFASASLVFRDWQLSLSHVRKEISFSRPLTCLGIRMFLE